MSDGGKATISERITDYLSSGGFFNPEMMEHGKVRDLLIDCRERVTSLEAECAASMNTIAEERARAEKAEAKCDRLREILQTLEKGGLEPWQSSQIARQALKDTKT